MSCLGWVRVNWLIRPTDDGGREVYSLSSSAQDALRIVEQLTKDRSISLNGHRNVRSGMPETRSGRNSAARLTRSRL
ncbi:MAG: DUF3375 family protein [Streptosporangiaceae bacterium]